MEPALRAYAGRRRADAGVPSLHPANRRQLQAEVARLRPDRAPAPRRTVLPFPWPRLAIAAAACAVLAFLLARPWSPSHPPAPDKPVALLEPRQPPRPPEVQPPSTPPPAVPAPAPTTAAAVAMTAAPAPAPAAGPNRAPAVAADAPPAPRLLAKGAPGPAARMAAPRPPERRRYQRSDPPGDGTTLLQSFDLEQTGSQVRLVDTDGSVYAGAVSPTNAGVFLVSGVQKTSGRAVTVEASFMAEGPDAAEAAPAAPAARAARSAPRVAASPGPSAGPALQLRIRPEGGPESRGIARPVAR